MKTFNLEQAKAGKPIVTREGNEAKFIAHVPEADHPLHRLVILTEGTVVVYGEDGNFLSDPSDYDLFMKTEEVTLWINCYEAGIISYKTKEEADARSDCVHGGRIGEARPFTYTLE